MIFYSPNVHAGGGAELQSLLLYPVYAKKNIRLFLDERFLGLKCIDDSFQNIVRCRSSIFGRVNAERLLMSQSKEHDNIFCFHNLPPLFKVKGNITVFFQNVNILTPGALKKSSVRVRVRNYIERFILLLLKKRVNKFIVQSSLVKKLLVETIGVAPSSVDVFPFYRLPELSVDASAGERNRGEFIYVADGVAHKNHKKLLAAWKVLANQGFRPRLRLTLGDRDSLLWKEIQLESEESNLDIVNIGHVPNKTIFEWYRRSDAMIFPSLHESFGLPLIEASRLNLPIIASELDYVREVSNPVETFDPNSEFSIARAIARYMDYDLEQLKINSPNEFIEKYFMNEGN